uniref:PHD domain-containing protein n=1 Tax=Macrostomum lignano TaxID=282301 RepID=A0A1I8JG97_9PLAT
MVGSLVEAYYFKFDYFIIDGGQDGISVNVHRERAEQQLLLSHEAIRERQSDPEASQTVAPLTDNVLFYNVSGWSIIGDDEEEELSVRCPCERDADMGIMIRCEACELWQHAVCFGILRESEAPPVHYCEVCIESKFLCETGNLADNSHDQLLQRMRAPVERRSFCLVRAALNALLELNDPVTPGRLSERLSVPVQSAGSLVKKLVELGALAAPSAGAGASDYVIDRVLLRRQLLPKFFGRACRSGGAGGFEESSSKASADSNAEVAMEDKRKKQPEAGQTAGGRKRPGRPPGKRGAGAAAGAATTPKSRRAGGASSKRGRYGSVVNTPLKI